MTTTFAAKVFVTLVFGVFALAFFAESGMLFHEFGPSGAALLLAAFDTQNFIFFPIAGVAALVAFWRPGVLVVDAYARGVVPGGRLILVGGFVLAGLATVFMANSFGASDTRSMFEVEPSALVADDGAPASLDAPARAPILTAVRELQFQSRMDGGLSAFRDSCAAEQINFDPANREDKYCFVMGDYAPVAECCQAKANFRAAVSALHASAPSRTGEVHRIVLPIKIFFLFTLLAIGLMLARRRKRLRAAYGEAMDDFSLAVPLGATLMLLWPVLNSAYTQSYDVLIGDGGNSAYRVSAPLIALAFASWAMTLLFYHLRSYPNQAELALQSLGVLVAGFGILRYEALVTYANSTLGIGANIVSLLVFVVAVIFICYVFITREDEGPTGDDKAA